MEELKLVALNEVELVALNASSCNREKGEEEDGVMEMVGKMDGAGEVVVELRMRVGADDPRVVGRRDGVEEL